MFDYDLPSGRIAQRPAAHSSARHDSKLLWAKKSIAGKLEFIKDEVYSSLPNILKPSDLLIFNNSKVIPTRFFFLLGKKEIEVLLLRNIKANTWEALARPMKKLITGLEFELSPLIKAKVVGRSEDLSRILLNLSSAVNIIQAIKETGSMPIPPYIRAGKSDLLDREQYQTEYAEHEGSVAAPTAGLHFSKELIAGIREKGIEIDFVTLHVSQWSFSLAPEQGTQKVSEEYYKVSAESWERIQKARKEGRRVITVGTTCVRALESRALLGDDVAEEFQASSLYIKSGFEFQVVDAMITNFHQPNSTHLALVGTFFGGLEIEEVYQHALREEYRFLSYGDGCFLERKL